MLRGERAIAREIWREVGHAEWCAVGHRSGVRARAVRAFQLVCAVGADAAATGTALAVERRDLRLAQISQNALAAGGRPEGRVLRWGPVFHTSQEAVDVL